jgi:heptosyltransferase-2
MALPFYEALRAAAPRAHLCLLTVPAVAGLPFPCFDEVRVLAPGDRSFPGGAWRAGRALRDGGFELGIGLPASLSSALVLCAAGIPRRVGFAEPASALLLTDPIPWRGRAAGRHKAALYLDLLKPLLDAAVPLPEPAPFAGGRDDLVVIAPGASIALREWPGYAELIPALRRRYPRVRVAVVGGAREAAWKARLQSLRDPGVEDLIGATSLPELVELLGHARLVVANDSGVAHLAASVAGASTLVLFGPGDPDYIRPRGPRVFEALVEGLPCRPCESAHCRARYGYAACLKRLSVDEVLRKIDIAGNFRLDLSS